MIKTAEEIRKMIKEDKIKTKEKAKKEDKETKQYLKNLAIADAFELLKNEIPELASMFYYYVCEFNKQLPYPFNVSYYYKEFQNFCEKYGYKTELTSCTYNVYNTLHIKISWKK